MPLVVARTVVFDELTTTVFVQTSAPVAHVRLTFAVVAVVVLAAVAFALGLPPDPYDDPVEAPVPPHAANANDAKSPSATNAHDVLVLCVMSYSPSRQNVNEFEKAALVVAAPVTSLWRISQRRLTYRGVRVCVTCLRLVWEWKRM